MELIHLVVFGLVGFGLIIGVTVWINSRKKDEDMESIRKKYSISDTEISRKIFDNCCVFEGELCDELPSKKFLASIDALSKECMDAPLHEKNKEEFQMDINL